MEEFMKEWFEYVEREEKRAKCPHNMVLWGADNKTGICFTCGATIKRKSEGVVKTIRVQRRGYVDVC